MNSRQLEHTLTKVSLYFAVQVTPWNGKQKKAFFIPTPGQYEQLI
jgi:hypothetical protein